MDFLALPYQIHFLVSPWFISFQFCKRGDEGRGPYFLYCSALNNPLTLIRGDGRKPWGHKSLRQHIFCFIRGNRMQSFGLNSGWKHFPRSDQSNIWLCVQCECIFQDLFLGQLTLQQCVGCWFGCLFSRQHHDVSFLVD